MPHRSAAYARYLVVQSSSRRPLRLSAGPVRRKRGEEWIPLPARAFRLEENTSLLRVGWDPIVPGRPKVYRRGHSPKAPTGGGARLLAAAAASPIVRGSRGTEGAKKKLKAAFFLGLLERAAEPIDYLEFGVYRGESLRLLQGLLKSPRSRLFGFDTFSGYPEPWLVRGRVHRGREDYALAPSEREEILRSLAEGKRTTLVPGRFQETLLPFLRARRLRARRLVYLNSDLYSSALFVLTALFPYVTERDIFVTMLGGPSRRAHELRALTDFVSAYGLGERIEFLQHTADLWHVAFRIRA